MSPRIATTTLVTALSVLFSAVAAAQAEKAPAPAQATASPVASSRLEITLAMSRTQASAGGGLGVTGTLINVGRDSTIYLTSRDVALMAPPELYPHVTGNTSLFAYFPTEPSGLSADSIVIALTPGSRYRVRWLIEQQDSTLWARLRNEVRYVLFSPGEYEIVASAKYWTNPARPKWDYHTYTQSTKLQVGSPQSVILLGSMIGGLLAYLLFPSRRSGETVVSKVNDGLTSREVRLRRTYEIGKRLWGVLGAMLWSAIVTILLSRLAESQFVIRVTIADFWGAIAIGFVAQYAGSKWLERLVPNSPDPTPAVDGADHLPAAPGKAPAIGGGVA